MHVRKTSQSAEEMVRTGVSDHVTWMEDVQCLKVVVDGVTDHHFTLQDGKDLQEVQQRRGEMS